MTGMARMAALAIAFTAHAIAAPERADGQCTRTAELEIHFYGMIGFAPADGGGMEVVLVDETNPHPGGAKHFPAIELNCKELSGCLASQCHLWLSPRNDPNSERKAISLDSGYRIELIAEIVSDLAQQETSLGEPVIRMARLAPNDDRVARMRRSAVDPAQAKGISVASLRLQGGRFDFTENRFGNVTIQPSLLGKEFYEGAVAQSVVWKATICMDSNPEIRLKPYSGSLRPDVVLQLNPTASSFSFVISNEPEAFDYCALTTRAWYRPISHFSRFYDLSTVADGHDHDQSWPLPYTSITSKQCKLRPEIADAGRRVNCMMVQFEGLGD